MFKVFNNIKRVAGWVMLGVFALFLSAHEFRHDEAPEKITRSMYQNIVIPSSAETPIYRHDERTKTEKAPSLRCRETLNEEPARDASSGIRLGQQFSIYSSITPLHLTLISIAQRTTSS